MLDPFTTLSVASNIAQFTDYGLRLTRVVRELHNSANGALELNDLYGNLANGVRDRASKIQRSLKATGPRVYLGENDSTLYWLADRCDKVAIELSDFLEPLKTKDESSRLKTFRIAMANVWNEKHVKELVSRLEMVRADLDSHMLLNISNKLDHLFTPQSEQSGPDSLTQSTKQAVGKDRDQEDGFLPEQSDAFIKLHQMIEQCVMSTVEDAKLQIISAVRMPNWTTDGSNWANPYESMADEISTRARKTKEFKESVARTLRFPAMTERLEDIPEAHKSTFQWAYDQSRNGKRRDNFSEWLSYGTGIYWVQGKPGSGKSCLMKYLYEEPRTSALLRVWAGSIPLVTAGFFFWYPGTEMQKSQNGLLRYLLLQILAQQPKLIPIAFPDPWDLYVEKKFQTDIPATRKELIRAVRRVANQKAFPLKLCLFIDGLDEYTGNHLEFVTLLKDISNTPTTKLCVSSRPWPVFKNSFSCDPGLTLQDLTGTDITKYVKEILEESPGMKALQQEEPENASLLVQDIVEKSSGVFLWVKLVVASLLSGLMNNDHICDLEQRLQQLPGDLEELYIYLLKRIDPFYLTQALQLLRLIQQARRPLPSLAVAVADEANLNLFIQSWPQKFSDEDLASRCMKIEEKIQSRCLGLLECNLQPPPPEITPESPIYDSSVYLDNLIHYAGYKYPSRRVQYMHRTVLDFFDKPESWVDMESPLMGKVPEYNTSLTLCFASLVQLKRVFAVSNYGSWASAVRPFWALIKDCIQFATKVEPTYQALAILVLDDLENTATFHYQQAMRSAKGVWPKTWVHTIYRQYPPDCDRQTTFLAFATTQGLEYYINAKLKDIHDCEKLCFLLEVAVAAKPINPKMLKTLLDHGADPNTGSQNATIWQKLLSDISSGRHTHQSREEGPITQQQNEILECFITSGADLQAQCPKKHCLHDGVDMDTQEAVFVVLRTGNPRLVGMMLERGVDPNREYSNGLTLWQEALLYTYQEVPRLLRGDLCESKIIVSRWLEIYKLLLEFQTDPMQTATLTTQRQGSRTTTKDPAIISIFSVIRETLSKWDAIGAADLEARLPKSLAVDIRREAISRSHTPLPPSPLSPSPLSPSPLSPSPLSPCSPGSPGSVSGLPSSEPESSKKSKRASLTKIMSKLKF